MITPEQVKAARALLKITATELSSLSGVQIAMISAIESRKANMTKGAGSKLFIALRNKGIEFLGNSGVNLSETGVSLLTEPIGLEIFLDLLYRDVQLHADNYQKTIVRVGNANECLLLKHTRNYIESHVEKMLSVYKNGLLEMHATIERHDSNHMALEYATYKHIQPTILSQIAFYIWHDKFALIESWDPLKIMMVSSKNFADLQKLLFDHIWNL